MNNNNNYFWTTKLCENHHTHTSEPALYRV